MKLLLIILFQLSIRTPQLTAAPTDSAFPLNPTEPTFIMLRQASWPFGKRCSFHISLQERCAKPSWAPSWDRHLSGEITSMKNSQGAEISSKPKSKKDRIVELGERFEWGRNEEFTINFESENEVQSLETSNQPQGLEFIVKQGEKRSRWWDYWNKEDGKYGFCDKKPGDQWTGLPLGNRSCWDLTVRREFKRTRDMDCYFQCG